MKNSVTRQTQRKVTALKWTLLKIAEVYSAACVTFPKTKIPTCLGDTKSFILRDSKLFFPSLASLHNETSEYFVFLKESFRKRLI